MTRRRLRRAVNQRIRGALTDEDGAEEEGDGDVGDRGRHVQKPVGRHGEESQEEQEEEQTVLVILNLRDTDQTVDETE